MIKAPYNFVPLNDKVYVPKWWDMVSHDIPFEDGESGSIEVLINNLSPIFTRDSNTQNNDHKDIYSSHIEINGEKRYFIPATSIKGMFQNIMEVMTFSKMEKFNNDYFAYRNFDTKLPDGKAYIEQMQKIRCGWLIKKENDLYIYPCDGEYQKISHSEIKNSISKNFKPTDSADNKQKTVCQNGQLYPEVRNGYKLVCTGAIFNKKHEYLFPVNNLGGIKVSNEVKQAFLTTHKPTPLFETYWIKKIKKGDSIPVFYIANKDNTINCIGLTRMIRKPYNNCVSDCVKQDTIIGNDLCKTIFGFTENDNLLKGRVQFGHAFCKKTINENELLPEVKGVLGNPKASYYPLYLKHDSNRYNTYDNKGIIIAGRKRYRIHKGKTTTSLPQGNDNEKVISSFKPLPSDLQFKLRINIHNLKPIEIGAIISAITFHDHESCFHNIGLAKGYGFGKIKCNITNLLGLANNKDYYMRVFEEEINHFTLKQCNTNWYESEQITALFNIAQVHEDDDLRIMSLEDYKKYKTNNNFDNLKEKNIGITSKINFIKYQEAQIREKLVSEFKKAEQFEKEGLFYESINIYRDILIQLSGFESNDIEYKIAELQMQIKQQELIEKKNIEEEQKQRLIKKLERGLSFLEETDINGSFKVKDFKGAKSRIDQLLKKSGIDSLGETDKLALKNALARLFKTSKSNELKEWKIFDGSNIWRSIISWIGEEMARNWHEELIK